MHKVNSPADLPPNVRVFDTTNYDDFPTIPIPKNEDSPIAPGQVGVSTEEHGFPFDIIESSRDHITLRTKDGRNLTVTPETLDLKDLWRIAPIKAWGKNVQDLRLLLETVRSFLIQKVERQATQEVHGPKPWRLEVSDFSWLVEPFFPTQGLVGIIGATGAKKTYLTLDLALSVATGKPFLGECVVDEPGGVLWISPESRSEQVCRGLAWCRARGVNHKTDLNRFYVMEDRLILPSDEWKLLDAARKVPDLRLLVIDPMIEFLGSQDENNNAVVASVLASIQHVVDALGILAIVTHHTGHGQDRGRGGSAFRGKLDREFLIKPENDGSLTMEPTKIRGYGFPPTIRVGFELIETGRTTRKGKAVTAGVLSYQGHELRETEKGPRLGVNQEAILEWLNRRLEEDAPPSFEQARDYFKLEWGKDKVQRYFKRTIEKLIEKGHVFMEGKVLFSKRYLARHAQSLAKTWPQGRGQNKDDQQDAGNPIEPPDGLEQDGETESQKRGEKARLLKQKMRESNKGSLEYQTLKDPLWKGIAQNNKEAEEVVNAGVRMGLFKVEPGRRFSLRELQAEPPVGQGPDDCALF